MRYLRNKKDGTIYDWDEYLARNSKVEEVTEEVAFPERFISPKQAVTLERKRKTKTTVNKSLHSVTKPDIVDENPELSKDASKGLYV